MVGSNSGSQAQGWRARDGRVIKEGDVIAPVPPSYGVAGLVFIEGVVWRIVRELGDGQKMVDDLSAYLRAAGYNPGDDSYNVVIISNLLDVKHG